MAEKKQLIKNYITKLADQINEQYQGLIDEDKINKAMSMFVNSSDEYDAIIERINELVNQLIQNYLKEQEKRFAPELVKENHEEIYNKLEILIKKLNEKGVDYQLAGALCAYIKYGVESNRTHDDIDINLNEADINKFKEVCEEMGLQFHDKRTTTSRVLKNGIPSGEHEVIATLDASDFHIGAFCFERKPDGTVINKGYYHDGNGQIFSRNDIISPELASEIFGREQATFRGQKLFITPPEFIYKLKSYTQNPKDKVDLSFMESRIDRNKLERINELSETSHIEHQKVSNFIPSQNFNYHTHAYRPSHSEYISDEEILKTAKQMGITALGFSEHIPNPGLILPDEDNRMLLSEVDEYISLVDKMKNENPNMTILAGFEAEYDPMKESFLGTMRNKVDYMILGQQYVSRNLNNINGINNPNYPIEYANMVAKGIDSGIFDIVAYPDLFMQFRNSMIDEESKKLFDKNSILASQIICEKSRDMGIPLEVNLGLFSKDESMAYPSTIFWKVASEIDGLQVLLGIDFHNLNAIKGIDKSLENVSGIIEMLQDKMVSSNYNPVVARENNPKLQEAYNKGQEKALTFETHMINQTLNSICDNLSDNLTPEEIALGISQGLDMTMKDCVRYANAKDKVIVDEITKIGNNPNMPMEEKKIKASRKKKAVEETNQVLKNQQSAIENAKNNVLNSMNIGCQSKEEFVNMTTQMIEYGSTAKETHKAKIENQITEFQATKDISNTIVNTKSPTLVRKQNPDNHNNNSGFANTLAIILVVTFIASFVAVITYTICSKW